MLALGLGDVGDAAKIIRPDQAVWVIVGDRAKIEPGVRELNLGPITVIDADGQRGGRGRDRQLTWIIHEGA